MTRNRLEAFTDGMIAIFITVMVLDLRPPHEASWSAVSAVLPTFLMYVLSFVYLAIYWNNHHHLFHLVDKVDGAILWANMNLLFWLSLVPFVTGWMGETSFERLPTVVYGVDLFLCALSYTLLQATIIRSQGRQSAMKASMGRDGKGKLSLVLYAAGVGSAFVSSWFAGAFYLAVALIWLVPDRRIERRVG